MLKKIYFPVKTVKNNKKTYKMLRLLVTTQVKISFVFNRLTLISVLISRVVALLRQHRILRTELRKKVILVE
jgi:hypothetical protein